MIRPSARTPEQLRPLSLEAGVSRYAEGSCLAKFGNQAGFIVLGYRTQDLPNQFPRRVGFVSQVNP